jgi:Nucleotidyl transferase of unknown function (DUF2204)
VSTGERAELFYRTALNHLAEGGVPFMVGGSYALREYAGVVRDTKDLDIFCKPDDHPRILNLLISAGYQTEVTYPNWLAKAFHHDHTVDIIFSSGNSVCRVDDTWFRHARPSTVFGVTVQLIPPEEMIWSKVYVQDRGRFDGADIAHIILKQSGTLDWHRLLVRAGSDSEVLFAQLINFRFVYPSERDAVPEWVMRELWSRIERQFDDPPPADRVCRGPLFTPYDYEIDVMEWGYQDARTLAAEAPAPPARRT